MMMTCTMAQNVGVSMMAFDDLFLTNLRGAIAAKAKEAGVNVQFEDAQGDIGKQLNQIQNFIAKKVDAIVVSPVDSSATAQMTKLIQGAGISLVYVNIPPIEELKPGEPVVRSSCGFDQFAAALRVHIPGRQVRIGREMRTP